MDFWTVHLRCFDCNGAGYEHCFNKMVSDVSWFRLKQIQVDHCEVICKFNSYDIKHFKTCTCNEHSILIEIISYSTRHSICTFKWVTQTDLKWLTSEKLICFLIFTQASVYMLINPYTVNSKVLCFSSFLGYIFCRKFGSLFSVYVNGYSKLLAKTEKKD